MQPYLKILGVARGLAQEARAPSNQNATNDKNLTKKPGFFIFSFF